MSIHLQVEAARAGREPALISRLPSGWVVLCQMQFLRGYCILMPDPVVPSLNTLDRAQRAQYLCDMALVGDALMEVTGAYRVNYAILGNSDQVLHAHIVPRFADEPDEYRQNVPWSYPPEMIDALQFDVNRDRELMNLLSAAIRERL